MYVTVRTTSCLTYFFEIKQTDPGLSKKGNVTKSNQMHRDYCHTLFTCWLGDTLQWEVLEVIKRHNSRTEVTGVCT